MCLFVVLPPIEKIWSTTANSLFIGLKSADNYGSLLLGAMQVFYMPQWELKHSSGYYKLKCLYTFPVHEKLTLLPTSK